MAECDLEWLHPMTYSPLWIAITYILINKYKRAHTHTHTLLMQTVFSADIGKTPASLLVPRQICSVTLSCFGGIFRINGVLMHSVCMFTNLQLCFAKALRACVCICGTQGRPRGRREVLADSLCFCERLWHHQHNERAEICGG